MTPEIQQVVSGLEGIDLNQIPRSHPPEDPRKGKMPADIHVAIMNDDANLIQAILHHGYEINLKGQGGQTPLMDAILNGKLEVTKYLLENGADPMITEDHGYTAMDAAAFAGQYEIINILVKRGLPVDMIGSDG